MTITNDHYVGPAHNHPAPSFHVVVDFYKGCMILVRLRDEEHVKPIWLVKVLSSSNFVPTSPNFCQIEVEYCRPRTKDQNVLCIYLGWDTKKCVSEQWTQHTNQFGYTQIPYFVIESHVKIPNQRQ